MWNLRRATRGSGARLRHYRSMTLRLVTLLVILVGSAAADTETPAKLVESHDGFDYTRKTVEIAMRDGVKLHTVILIPKAAKRAPILLTRTPYDADKMTAREDSTHLAMALSGYDHVVDTIIEGGYIRVVQDVRGKYGSEGDYVMNRPLRGPLNPTKTDHSTDTYDTIDWLVKNLPESNGKVGILGVSYDGFTPLMAIVDPHPALKVSVPMNPMVDGWRGDDWFHNGAFRQQGLPYIYNQEATRKNESLWPASSFDQYDMFMDAGSAGELARRRGLDQMGFWQKLVAHPSYDAFWRDQAMDKILGARPLKVPVMLVHSLWDQEDMYGALAVYKALEPKDTANDKVFLVMGPWHHGGEIGDGSTLGPLHFDSDTGLTFRRDILLPFLDHFLKDAAPPLTTSPVTAFETGTNQWRHLRAWPVPSKATPIYLAASGKLVTSAPAGDAFVEYISDPAKPVTFVPRPFPFGEDGSKVWPDWLVTDQRDPGSRPDVLVYTTDVLTAPLVISGEPVVHLTASTSGTDSDWVVKLIDVYPPEVERHPALGGYQLAIAMDIFRGRYRESLATAKPLAASTPLAYTWALPTTDHVFLPGHRIMVQVQSSWFPLYDRNPQTFVSSIFDAKPGDYKKATQRVYGKSYVELPVVAR